MPLSNGQIAMNGTLQDALCITRLRNVFRVRGLAIAD